MLEAVYAICAREKYDKTLPKKIETKKNNWNFILT